MNPPAASQGFPSQPAAVPVFQVVASDRTIPSGHSAHAVKAVAFGRRALMLVAASAAAEDSKMEEQVEYFP